MKFILSYLWPLTTHYYEWHILTTAVALLHAGIKSVTCNLIDYKSSCEMLYIIYGLANMSVAKTHSKAAYHALYWLQRVEKRQRRSHGVQMTRQQGWGVIWRWALCWEITISKKMFATYSLHTKDKKHGLFYVSRTDYFKNIINNMRHQETALQISVIIRSNVLIVLKIDTFYLNLDTRDCFY